MKSDVVGPRDFEIKIKVHVRADREVITEVVYPENWRDEPPFEHLVGLAIHAAHDNYRSIVKDK
jgi:hypothetical protein